MYEKSIDSSLTKRGYACQIITNFVLFQHVIKDKKLGELVVSNPFCNVKLVCSEDRKTCRFLESRLSRDTGVLENQLKFDRIKKQNGFRRNI